MAQVLVEQFNGDVPSEIKELQKLPGIGRKSANVIAAVVFNKPVMAVDTHVFRVSRRLGLAVNSKTPYNTEMQLVRYIPENKIPLAHHWLILHGRYICLARRPKCRDCGLTDLCRYYNESKTVGLKFDKSGYRCQVVPS
jgi:endonuclease-3